MEGKKKNFLAAIDLVYFGIPIFFRVLFLLYILGIFCRNHPTYKKEQQK